MIAGGGILNEGYPENEYERAGSDRKSGKKIVHMPPGAQDRVPPHSNDAEMAVLGAMMLEKEAASKVIQLLPPDSFYREAHRIIYQSMLALAERNQPIDIITLNDELRRIDKLADVGGSHYLSELNLRTPTAANVEHHARIVFEKALKRRLIHAATEIVGNCYSETSDAFEEVDHAEQKIFEIAESRNGRTYQPIKRLAIETVEMLEALHARRKEGNTILGVPSGLMSLDGLTGGFQKSDLIILAARPSMGKTALAMSIARNAAIDYKKGVAFFSLEMAALQLVVRLLAAESRINAQQLRNGDLKDEEWQTLVSKIHHLVDSPLYIDDTPALGIMELRARARLMKREHNIEMLVVDYLQLMHAPKAESREREISMISRGLKQLAKELDIPIIALSQLNRSVESRGDKRPMLSDLRESGCLTGETLVPIADTGERVPIRSLLGKNGFSVWALNPSSLTLEKSIVSNVFCTGRKPVFRMTTQLGRTIRATANHKFLTIDGWKRLDHIADGERIAVPRQLPGNYTQSITDAELALLGHLIGDGCTLERHAIQYTTREHDLAEIVADLARTIFAADVEPRIKQERSWYQVYLSSTRHHTHGVRSAVAEWLEKFGIWALRSHQKHVPAQLFQQPPAAVATFLRHLWSTDGCVRPATSARRYPAIYYATSSNELARDVQSLLLHVGINARLKKVPQGTKGRDQYHVIVSGHGDIVRFIETVGACGRYKTEALYEIRTHIAQQPANTNRDVIPSDIWNKFVRPSMQAAGISHRELHERLGMAYSGMTIFRQNVSRDRAARVAQAVQSTELEQLASSGIYWDPLVSVEPDGEEEVFDLTVPGPHNFVANDLIPHNSIEQDADVVMFVHRPEYYGINVDEDGHPTAGVAEIIIGKQRNGPTGIAKTAFLNEYARFENLAFHQDNASQYLPPAHDELPPF